MEQGDGHQAPYCSAEKQGDRRAARCSQSDLSFRGGSETLSGRRAEAWSEEADEVFIPVLNLIPFSAEHLELALNSRNVAGCLKALCGALELCSAHMCPRAAPLGCTLLSRGAEGFLLGRAASRLLFS